MSARSLTLTQLRSHLDEINRKGNVEGVIGVRVTNGWEGGDRVESGGRGYRIVHAETPLAVRAALLAAEEAGEPTVLLTPLDPTDLGQDVLGRLARWRLFQLDLWESVRGLFRARDIGAPIRSPHIARALLEHAPPDGYPPVPAGVLDADTAWRALFRHALGLDPEPTLESLLYWAALNEAGVARYREAHEELRVIVRERLTLTLGAAAGSVLDFIEGGHAADALALSLACEVIFAEGADAPELQAAAVRLERFHQNKPLPPAVGRQLARAAGELIRSLYPEERATCEGQLARADEILGQVQAAGHAHLGRHTRRAWEERLGQLACALSEALTSRATPHGPIEAGRAATCHERARLVGDHLLAAHYSEQAGRVGMACRLVRWLQLAFTPPTTFVDLARAYRDGLAYVDWARDTVSGGDPLAGPELSVAYRLLGQEVHARCARFNEAFAAALANDHAADSVLPVEGALDQVVLPLVKQGNRLLLVVLDGMSWAVAHELLPELRKERWQELTWLESGQTPPSLLAAIPSVTELSRASLLSGRLTRGNAAAEKKAFAEHPGLAVACGRSHPPVLFHKARLTEGPRGALHPEVQQAVLSDKHKVVAVVINAIDDELSGAEQVRHPWDLEAVRPLGALLRAARDAGRVVLLCSDHGHVWHHEGSTYRQAEGGGERWRPATGAPEAGEVRMEGPRVQDNAGGSAVIVPWDEGLRYGVAKNGYHGGVAPQEVLAPLVILAPAGTECKGLTRCEGLPPPWWEEPVPALPQPPASAPTSRPRKRPTSLFDFNFPEAGQAPAQPTVPAKSSPAEPPPAWPAELLRSAVYAAQKGLAGKHLPDDDAVRKCLEVLDQHGHTMTPAALAQQADIVPLRLDGFLAKLQRILNVDGYEVLQVDRAQNRVTINVPFLRRQFELG